MQKKRPLKRYELRLPYALSDPNGTCQSGLRHQKFHDHGHVREAMFQLR